MGIQCACDVPGCCLEEQQATQKPTEPEPEAESTTPSGPPPPSKCTSDGGYQCLTKAEVQFYFELDEVWMVETLALTPPSLGPRGASFIKLDGSQIGAGTRALANLNVDVKM